MRYLAPLLEGSADGRRGRTCPRGRPGYRPRDTGKLSYARDALVCFAQSIARARPDFLYVPTADGLSQMLVRPDCWAAGFLPRGLHSEALLLRGSFAYPGGLGWRQRVPRPDCPGAAAEASPWSILYHLDPLVCDRARPGRLRLMPDPVETPAASGPAARADVLGGWVCRRTDAILGRPVCWTAARAWTC